MNNLEEKIKDLFEEREMLITEMSEIKAAFDMRQQRLIEIAGSIKTLQELLSSIETDLTKDDATKK